MICPFASYLPVGNHGGPMSGHIGLVLHVQQGNGSLYGYFDNPASQVSAHFWCSKAGNLEQYLDTDLTAWAEVAGNANYLSVETEGVDTESLTPAQVSTVARLLTWCANAYGFPVTGPVPHGTPGFTPHCNPNGSPDPAWGNHPCPGSLRLAQMPTIIAATHPQPSRTETNMLTHDPKSNGYWGARPNATVYTFDGAPYIGPLAKYTAQWGIGTAANPVVGIAADGNGGFALLTDSGGSQPAIYNIPANGQYAK